MGDSFTAGLGDPEPLSPGGMRGWADRIAEELSEGRTDFRYANLAVSGLLLRQILDRQLGPAIALKPDLVTLSAGGNDLVFHRSDPDRLAADPRRRSGHAQRHRRHHRAVHRSRLARHTAAGP